MTNREEIRKVIDTYVDDGCLFPDKTCPWCSREGYCASGNDAYTCLMKRLNKIGVVIKVEKELPENPHLCTCLQGCQPKWCDEGFHEYQECQNTMVDAGYVATVPLIEE